jgi:hypothetical protein
MPDVSGTCGGAVAFNTKCAFSDLTSNVVPSVVSSSASDTGCSLAIYTLSATGVLQNESLTTAGTTVTSATLTASRIMKVLATGTTAVGDLAVVGNKTISAHTAQSGSASGMTLAVGDGANCVLGNIIRITNNLPSGAQYQLRMITSISTDTVTVNRAWTTAPTVASTYDVWNGALLDLSPNQITQVRRVFYPAFANAAGGSSNVFYEKVFFLNDSVSTSLTSASVTKQIDPVGLYSGGGSLAFALCTGLNDVTTLTTNVNPGTGPVSISAFSSGAAPQVIAIPSGGGVLLAGATPNAAGAVGCWLMLTLVAGEPTISSFIDLRTQGQSI